MVHEALERDTVTTIVGSKSKVYQPSMTSDYNNQSLNLTPKLLSQELKQRDAPPLQDHRRKPLMVNQETQMNQTQSNMKAANLVFSVEEEMQTSSIKSSQGLTGGLKKAVYMHQRNSESPALLHRTLERATADDLEKKPSGASYLGKKNKNYVRPTNLGYGYMEKDKHYISQFLKATSPRLKHNLEYIESQNQRMNASIQEFHQSMSSLKTQERRSSTIESQLEDGSQIKFANVYFDQNTLEPVYLTQNVIEQQYQLDKQKYKSTFDRSICKRNSIFKISNLISKSVNLQTMGDFQTTHNLSRDQQKLNRSNVLKKSVELDQLVTRVKSVLESESRKQIYKEQGSLFTMHSRSLAQSNMGLDRYRNNRSSLAPMRDESQIMLPPLDRKQHEQSTQSGTHTSLAAADNHLFQFKGKLAKDYKYQKLNKIHRTRMNSVVEKFMLEHAEEE